MISRRAALGTGAAVVVLGAGLHLAGIDDDLARAVGVEPRSEPDPADTALLESARTVQAQIVALCEQLDAEARETLLPLAREQLAALGSPSSAVSPSGTELSTLLRRGSEEAQELCLRATSPALARILASLSVGRTQLAAALGESS